MTAPDMRIEIGGLKMRNPVTVASGTFGYGPEYAGLIDLNRLGAITVKGISPAPVSGNPTPRIVEVPCGMINAIGLQNPGMEAFCRDYLPFFENYDTPVIVNIWGRSVEDYAAVARRLDGEELVAAFEINVSCPNIKEGSKAFGTRIDSFRRVVDAVRAVTAKPIIPKLAPQVASIADYALAAQDCGADGVSLINTIPAMAIDLATRRPILGNVVGGLSGPAIHPVALKMVWEVAGAVDIPIIAMGGICEPKDALDFIVAGASAVAVGTENFANPGAALQVLDGIEEYLKANGMSAIDELIGSLQT